MQISWHAPTTSWTSSQNVFYSFDMAERINLTVCVLLGWTYGIAAFIMLQMFLIMLQEHFGPAFFLPKGVCSYRSLVFRRVNMCPRWGPCKRMTTTPRSHYPTPKHPNSRSGTARYAWMPYRLMQHSASVQTRRAKASRGAPVRC